VKHFIERSQCLTLFATHYHSLLDEWKDEPMVRLGHMQCMVEDNLNDDGNNDDDGADGTNKKSSHPKRKKEDEHSITFLYTLGPGTCPKSFGINVARLASLPSEVLDNAKRVSQEFEAEMAFAHTRRHEESLNEERVSSAIRNGNWEEVERLWYELKNDNRT